MKNLISLIFIASIVSFNTSLSAQEIATASDSLPANYLDRSPLYDYSERILNHTDSIPDFQSKEEKLKITGTIYKSDGVTPAKDVILYISQTDEDGDYELKTQNGKRYIHHRGWVKTDADGQYTFYTFIPGTTHRSNELKHIHPIIKEPGKPEQDLDAFLFEGDPLLTKRCLKKLQKLGIDSILKLEKSETMYVATKDIILNQNTSEEL